MKKSIRPRHSVMFVALLAMTAGCGESPDLRDQRLAEFARESMIEQRIQNERMADQSEAVVRKAANSQRPRNCSSNRTPKPGGK